MMDAKVPGFRSECMGTGTVMVVVASRFCMMQWLPFWRTFTNPWDVSKAHMLFPENFLRGGNFGLEVGDP